MTNNPNDFLNSLNNISHPTNNITYTYIATLPDINSQINALKNENSCLKQILKLSEENSKLKDENIIIQNQNKIIQNAFIDFLKKTNNWNEVESIEYIQTLLSHDKL